MSKRIPSFFEYLDMQSKKQPEKQQDQNPYVRLGTVTAFVPDSTKATVVFDGDAQGASYPIKGNYYPLVGDRVLMVKVGATWVVDSNVGAAAKFASFYKPVVRLEQAAAQTGLVDSANTILTFGAGSTVIDTDDLHSETTNNTRVTVKVSGIYRVDVQPVYAFSNTITSMYTFVRKNGVTLQSSGSLKPAVTNVNQASTPLTVLISAVVGDYFEGGVRFIGTANQATNNSGSQNSSLQVEWVRPLP